MKLFFCLIAFFLTGNINSQDLNSFNDDFLKFSNLYETHSNNYINFLERKLELGDVGLTQSSYNQLIQLYRTEENEYEYLHDMLSLSLKCTEEKVTIMNYIRSKLDYIERVRESRNNFEYEMINIINDYSNSLSDDLMTFITEVKKSREKINSFIIYLDVKI